MKSYLVVAKSLMLSLLRDRASLFFSLALPLIFLLIFAPAFSQSGGNNTVKVAVFNTASAADRSLLENVLNGMTGLRTQYLESLDEVADVVALQQADFGLAWDGFVLEVLLNPARLQDNAVFTQITEGIRSQLDRKRLGLRDFIKVEVQKAEEGNPDAGLSYILPGVIALGVMSSGLFLISSSFMHMKERSVLKRLAATPLKKLDFLAGLITTRMALSVISACLILLVGWSVLGVRMPINWPLFVTYLIAATLIMSGAGALIALVAKSARSASEIAGLAMTIMTFFSGVYFPLEFLPKHFRAASLFLPATYVARGFRFALGVEPMAWARFALETGILLLASLAAIWAAAVRGSWDADRSE